ncbi:hypothetical protein DL240_15660 [Lujinxingia litoralis]|uniref:Uncharacterized protein n=1 Tax=Lujinxingia litoralis TaxID=2211119 RepID=A0A328C276_9DELT|nr:hypothetical protein [Lujinxingia litoralis]RAL20752.1 hypothetical protein DL240_15660 [Lujinxingia litoralis]
MMNTMCQAAVWRWVGVVALCAGLSGCVTPGMRQVEAVDSSATKVTFLYSQHSGEESDRGVIECDLEGDQLSNCQILDVEYQ